MKNQIITLLGISFCLTVLGGCGHSNTDAFLNDIEQLKAENTQLTEKADALEKENNQLREQAMTLSSLKRDVRLELIDTLSEIKIDERTGVFDKDNDGTPETLILYVTPLDNQQDAVKAVGQCDVELWDLNQPQGQAKIASAAYDPAALNQSWGGNIFSSYYRLPLESQAVTTFILNKKPKQLTVKVMFTDYIAGKTLTAQKVIDLD